MFGLMGLGEIVEACILRYSPLTLLSSVQLSPVHLLSGSGVSLLRVLL